MDVSPKLVACVMQALCLPGQRVDTGALLQETVPEAFDDESPQSKLCDAVLWASKVWQAWYQALVARSDPGHSIEEDPGSAIVRDLALRYMVSPKGAIKYIKEQTTILSACCLGQTEVPPLTGRGIPGVLGGGWVYRRCKSLMRLGKLLGIRDASSDSGFAACWDQIGAGSDILMSKLGFPPPPVELVDEEIAQYFEDMTHSKTLTAVEDQVVEEVKARITEIVGVVYQHSKFSPRHQLPSLNASFEQRRSEGGCLGILIAGYLKELAEKDGNLPPLEPVDLLFRVFDGGLLRSVKVPVRGLDLAQGFQEYVDRECLRVLERGCGNAKPFPIREPGPKVRIITMEDAALSYRALDLQKFLHGRLKSFPPFEFIGRPIDPKSWDLHFQKSLEENEFFLSGDYKGATNFLSSALSEHCWKEICRTVHWDDGGEGRLLCGSVWEEIGRIDLIDHLFYRSSKEGLIPVGRQARGQLMGSPTSFPVLCIINLAVTSLAMGWSTRKALSPGQPLVVNGDDVCAVISEEFYPQWSDFTRACGLEKSLGKNYTSRRFAVMNSEFRMCSPSLIPGFNSWFGVPFFNQSLAFGLERKGLHAGEDLKEVLSWWDLGDRAKELIEGCPPNLGENWLNKFIQSHIKILKTTPPGVSWTASKFLGGVGLPMVGDEPTVENRQFHTYLACLDDDRRARVLRFPRPDCPSILEEALKESMDYYSKFFPRLQKPREEMDVVLENWGFPVEKEKSDIGCKLRLAFVLDKICREYWPKVLSHIPKGPESPFYGLECPHGPWADILGMTKEERKRRETRWKTRFNLERRKVSSRLTQMAVRAQSAVLPYEHLDLENELELILGTLTCSKLHLMSVEKLVKWRSPLEEVIVYPKCSEGLARFGCWTSGSSSQPTETFHSENSALRGYHERRQIELLLHSLSSDPFNWGTESWGGTVRSPVSMDGVRTPPLWCDDLTGNFGMDLFAGPLEFAEVCGDLSFNGVPPSDGLF